MEITKLLTLGPLEKEIFKVSARYNMKKLLTYNSLIGTLPAPRAAAGKRQFFLKSASFQSLYLYTK